MEDRFGADYVHQMRLIRSYAQAVSACTKRDQVRFGKQPGRLAALDAAIEWAECEIQAYGEKV
jgi:hypothetical protein